LASARAKSLKPIVFFNRFTSFDPPLGYNSNLLVTNCPR
jgi:hypothetical protein